MHPAWARKFEPPAVSGSESVRAIRSLVSLHRATGEARFLTPIPPALAWLKRSTLPDGTYARFYELRTNKPLFMTKDYRLTYESNDVPTHYSFIQRDLGLAELDRLYREARAGNSQHADSRGQVSEAAVRSILDALDERGAWIEQGTLASHGYRGPIIDSRTFIRNISRLAAFLEAGQ
jgi:hypothetical protein